MLLVWCVLIYFLVVDGLKKLVFVKKNMHIICTKFEFYGDTCTAKFKIRPVSNDIEWYTINTVNKSVLNALSNSGV